MKKKKNTKGVDVAKKASTPAINADSIPAGIRTREEWLNKAVAEFQPLFNGVAELPPLKVSIGFPPKGGLGKRRTLGVCCMSEMASDKIPQIYINPTINEVGGAQGILAVLAHELIHACGVGSHGKEFRRYALHIGLEGKMTSSTAGESLQRFFDFIIKKLGDFPHASLNNTIPVLKPDKCRIHKCECPECGYTIRIAKKWIEVGIPDCPACKIELVQEIKDENI